MEASSYKSGHLVFPVNRSYNINTSKKQQKKIHKDKFLVLTKPQIEEMEVWFESIEGTQNSAVWSF